MLMAVNERTLKMGSAPIFPLLVSMAVPGLLGTLTTYLYRTVDQIFVGNFVGRTALGGISVLAPFNNVIIALSLFITVGGTSLLALTMGRRDYEEANILLNKSLQYYGDLDPVYSLIGGGELCISAVAIVNTVDNFIVSMTSGINQAVSPLISYNYGAKNYSRVKKASLCSQAMAGVFAIVIWSAMMLAPEFVCSLFGKGDEALISYGAMAMRACKMFALFGGFQMLVSMYFSSIGKPQVATFVSVSRHGLFLIPAMLIMPQFMGLKGVLYANSVSDGCSLIVVLFMYLHEMRRLSRLTDGEEIPAKRLINISKKSLTE